MSELKQKPTNAVVPPQDYEAARWFREAADQGYVFAQICLGENTKKAGVSGKTMSSLTCGSTSRRQRAAQTMIGPLRTATLLLAR